MPRRSPDTHLPAAAAAHKSLPFRPRLRLAGGCITLALLSACASHGPRMAATQEAAQYAARAKRSYAPPGPASDPWRPYILAASKRFDVPPTWIRQVMRVESGGHEYLNGQLTTSVDGAMGLMQIMPGTYDELRAQYGLGDDPYDPRDNIMAGAAYIRQMYDLYGSPGFLAAYNAGPGRLDQYLTSHVPLPQETRNYVAMIGPRIAGVYPDAQSPAQQYAMNAMPYHQLVAPTYAKPAYHPLTTPTYHPLTTQVAAYQPPPESPPTPYRSPAPVPVQLPPPRPVPVRVAPVQVAQLEPPRYLGNGVRNLAAELTPPPRRASFRLIPQAVAGSLPIRSSGSLLGPWAVQVGAYGTPAEAQAAIGAARRSAQAPLVQARNLVMPVHTASATLYRARLTGLSRDAALRACQALAHGRTGCIVLSPDAQAGS